jgi:hypothetical protein
MRRREYGKAAVGEVAGIGAVDLAVDVDLAERAEERAARRRLGAGIRIVAGTRHPAALVRLRVGRVERVQRQAQHAGGGKPNSVLHRSAPCISGESAYCWPVSLVATPIRVGGVPALPFSAMRLFVKEKALPETPVPLNMTPGDLDSLGTAVPA